MSVKTCQLCGKPLGRMRVGGDGDFCSREHRNQFRLRKGMDRLLEANKVASLMRRRESTKQIPSERLLSSPAMEARMAPPAGFRAQRVHLRPVRVSAASARPQISGIGAPVALQAPGERATGHWILPASAHSITQKVSYPPNRAVAKLAVGLPQAPAARIGFSVIRTADTPWESAAVRVQRQNVIGKPQFTISPAGQALGAGEVGFRPIGQQLRRTSGASRSANGFAFPARVPAQRGRRALLSVRNCLPRVARLRPMLLRSAPVAAYPLSTTLGIPPHGTRLRDFSYRLPSCAASQCAPLRLARAIGEHLLLETQFCATSWHNGSRVDCSHLSSAAWNSGSLAGNTRLDSLTAPQAQAADYRMAEIAFAPDAAFDYPPVRLQGSLSPAPPESPRQPTSLIEEPFHAGLEQWIGDTAGWQLDAAGARPAGLALLQPSLELDDYDFEFFARIETRGLTFVFRASNFSNYQKAGLALTESGGYELRRTVVIGGVEEPGPAVALRTPARSGAAFTIKTRARRNDFTIWFDGEQVAHWSDGRLPTGGIGFTAARNTKARIYWVKLAPLDGPHTEAAPRRLPRSIS